MGARTKSLDGQINSAFGDEIRRIYDQIDRMKQEFFNGKLAQKIHFRKRNLRSSRI